MDDMLIKSDPLENILLTFGGLQHTAPIQVQAKPNQVCIRSNIQQISRFYGFAWTHQGKSREDFDGSRNGPIMFHQGGTTPYQEGGNPESLHVKINREMSSIFENTQVA